MTGLGLSFEPVAPLPQEPRKDPTFEAGREALRWCRARLPDPEGRDTRCSEP